MNETKTTSEYETKDLYLALNLITKDLLILTEDVNCLTKVLEALEKKNREER